MQELMSPDDPDATIEKLVGIYRVLVPHLLATYSFHQRVTSDIVDSPTVRILKFMIDDDVEQLITGEMMIQDLARSPKLRTRAGKWHLHLDVMGGTRRSRWPLTTGRSIDRRGDRGVAPRRRW